MRAMGRSDSQRFGLYGERNHGNWRKIRIHDNVPIGASLQLCCSERLGLFSVDVHQLDVEVLGVVRIKSAKLVMNLHDVECFAFLSGRDVQSVGDMLEVLDE